MVLKNPVSTRHKMAFVMLYTGLFFSALFSCSPRFHIQKQTREMEKTAQDHTGILVYDPVRQKNIFSFNEEKYFTPASNIKILTLYSAFQLLGDSIPALRYVIKKDSLIFWGTGDPSFLYPGTFSNMRAFELLRNTHLPLYFSTSNFQSDHFGPGWSWDDYHYYFSAERSPFPLYGNCATFIASPNGQLQVFPSHFQNAITTSYEPVLKKKVVRKIDSNQFTAYLTAPTASYEGDVIPFRTDPDVIALLLSDTLQKTVTPIHYPLPDSALTLYSVPSDSMYRVMIQDSDNFIAEHVLLMCAQTLSDTLKSDIAIDYVKENKIADLPDVPYWVDGSGLSRYNLLTPRFIVHLWEKMLHVIPRDRLFHILAAGGKTGTIKDQYHANKPYVYGKTGTLSNIYCFSGYLMTKKGKTLIFSFMKNDVTSPLSDMQHDIENLLINIRNAF